MAWPTTPQACATGEEARHASAVNVEDRILYSFLGLDEKERVEVAIQKKQTNIFVECHGLIETFRLSPHRNFSFLIEIGWPHAIINRSLHCRTSAHHLVGSHKARTEASHWMAGILAGDSSRCDKANEGG